MVTLDVKAKITAPEEIEIPLVRADLLKTSNVFRTFFEIFLSIGAALCGVVISIDKPSTIHWMFLTVVIVAAISFLLLSFRAASEAKTTTKGSS